MDNSIDERLVNMVAELWISNGGDSLGFDMLERDIRDTIRTLEKEKE